MTYDGLLLIVLTQLHRYVVRRDQMIELRIVTSEDNLLVDHTLHSDDHARETYHNDNSPFLMKYYELAPLLDPNDAPSNRRRHAMIIASDQGPIAFLVERVEEMYQEHMITIQHLSPLFTNQLNHAWFLGVVILGETPLLVLDLNQIAQDVTTLNPKGLGFSDNPPPPGRFASEGGAPAL